MTRTDIDRTNSTTDDRPSPDVFAAKLPGAELMRLLDGLAAGDEEFREEVLKVYEGTNPPSGRSPDFEVLCAYGLLKFLSDEASSRAAWQQLAEAGRAARKRHDRDEVVFRLWSWIQRKGEDFVVREYRSLNYHRHRFFDWFLHRYDLRKARSLWRPHRWVTNAHLVLLLMIGVITWSSRAGWLGDDASVAILLRPSFLAVVGAYLGVGAWMALRFQSAAGGWLEAGVVALQSLVPRLAGASAAGALILASSEELLGFVVEGATWWRFGLLVGASVVYLLLEMSRRIHPIPRLRRLLLHGFDVSATAFTHALALALVAGPGMGSVLRLVRRFTGVELLNLAAFLFAIGLVVNLIWAEEPVTQPL